MEKALTPRQKNALTQALTGRIHAPATGAFRMRGGEVDGISCFSRRTISALVAKGLLVPSCGGYVSSDAVKAALLADGNKKKRYVS